MAKSICHMTCAHDVDDVRVFQKECVSLAEAGYNVVLVAPHGRNEEVDGVRIVGVPYRSKNPLYRLFVLSRRVYKEALKQEADLYHIHDVELFVYGIKLKRKGKKVIFDSHEDWPQYISDITWIPKAIRKVLRFYLVKSYRRRMRCFDAVLTVSPHIVDSIKSICDVNVDVVSNYPILDKCLPEIEVEHYQQRANCICYAGTVYRSVNHETLIKVIQDLDITYRIVGDIDAEFKQQLLNLDENNKVDFVDYVSRSELERIYSSSTIGMVVFDYIDNLGGNVGSMGINKIFEYMRAGLPILCTDFKLWKELIVDKYECGICVSARSESMFREAISQFISNKQLACQMGQNGQRAVKTEFNWDTQKEVLLAVYARLLD